MLIELQYCGRRVSRIRRLRGGRTIATITVAAPTMYPLEALPGDVYVRDGEKVAEVAHEVPVAARTIKGGRFSPQ
jgi:hypothetical protein